MENMNLTEEDKRDIEEFAEMLQQSRKPLRRTILVTGAPRSGKSRYIQYLTKNQAIALNQIEDLIIVWDSQTESGERVLYVEMAITVSRSETMSVQMGHFTEHFHLERADNNNTIVYCCPEIGLLESKTFHENYGFQIA